MTDSDSRGVAAAGRQRLSRKLPGPLLDQKAVGGIRHALKESEPEPTHADAKFMLVACTAFTSFLLTKAAELKIPIE
jgi:hypothetical protein